MSASSIRPIMAEGPPFIGGGGLFVAAFNVFELMKSKTMSILRLCFIFSFGVILMACDHFNVLIEYETWIARGMPVWGSLAVSPVGNWNEVCVLYVCVSGNVCAWVCR